MDPIGCAVSIADVAFKVVAALANLKDIQQDSVALRKLVRRVGTVAQDASMDLDSGSLSKPGAVSALEGLNETMADCLALVERLAKKSTIAKFFTAGNHVAELRAIMLRLSHDLGAFQTSLGIEQHSDIKKVLVDLRADLVNLPLEMLGGYEAQAARLREQLGCMREEAGVEGCASNSSAGAALVEERVAAAVLASLEQAGVVKKGSTGVSAQDVADITAALRGELKELRRDKQDMEAQYLSQIMAALTLRQAEVGYGASCSSSSSSSRAAAAPVASSMPPDFLCPITMCVMRDPVIVETGHSFERQAIQRHLATKNTNPVTNLPLMSKTLIDNIGLRNSIQSWLSQLGLTHEQADSALPAAAAPPVPHLAPTVRVAAQVAQPPVPPQDAKKDLEKRDEEELARRRLDEEAIAAAVERRKQDEAAITAATDRRKRDETAAVAADRRKQEEGAAAAATERRKQEEGAAAAATERRKQEEAAAAAATAARKRQKEAAAAAAAERKKQEEAAAAAATAARKQQKEAAAAAAAERAATVAGLRALLGGRDFTL